MPTEVSDDDHRQQSGKHSTDVVAGHQGGCRGAGLAPGPELGNHRDRRRQRTTQARTGEETPGGEPEHVGGECQEQREQGEEEHRHNKHPAAAEFVSEESDHKCTDRHADQTDGGDLGGLRTGEIPCWIFQHGGQGGAKDHQIEAIEKHCDPAQQDDYER